MAKALSANELLQFRSATCTPVAERLLPVSNMLTVSKLVRPEGSAKLSWSTGRSAEEVLGTVLSVSAVLIMLVA